MLALESSSAGFKPEHSPTTTTLVILFYFRSWFVRLNAQRLILLVLCYILPRKYHPLGGGGGVLNTEVNSETVSACAHAPIPAFHTMVSRLRSPFIAICTN